MKKVFATFILTGLWIGAAHAAANVCDRSPLVVADLVERTKKSCDQITDVDLALLDHFQIGFNDSLITLAPNDLDGLDKIRFFYLNCNDNLKSLPADLLNGKSPDWIAVHSNPALKSLPKDFFSGLLHRADRQTFALMGNGLSDLPESLYQYLRDQAVFRLELSRNPLSTATLVRLVEEFKNDKIEILIDDFGVVHTLNIERK